MISKQNKGPKSLIAHRLLTWLRLSNQPLVKVYRGYGNDKVLSINGHVLRRSALPRTNYRDNKLINLLAVMRLFLVKPYPNTRVRLSCAGQTAEVFADENGFFQCDLPLPAPLSPGWHPVRAELLSQTLPTETVLGTGEGKVLIPAPTTFACISDIDDTFLVSHSATIAKRLLVLLTENAHSRDPFDGVVAHYQLLAQADSGPATNPFFYVSSSEWNLYDYILEFSEQNGLPDGVYLLSKLKQFHQLLQTGKTKHHTKFDRIKRILETYPDMRFILLGDDSQQDPVIYSSVVQQFCHQISCVYIRRIKPANRAATEALIGQIEAAGVPCCYFTHSEEAHQHSIRAGLVAS
ncbi:App1 family protein [Spirosoma rhododendri]|uniref:DUF2183 domain-containing protein n=1 Tax=Spirosoma rhododendri TaxID=2728024 RepID=A0A7L5DIB9_9BACT|nr:phosphatase domain-containing protein [Spirosoma rhododendri]QJD77111.1 DUF2183 domain-containing protein [Spirosoma rhododendri]